MLSEQAAVSKLHKAHTSQFQWFSWLVLYLIDIDENELTTPLSFIKNSSYPAGQLCIGIATETKRCC